jgi:hypothetical protein
MKKNILGIMFAMAIIVIGGAIFVSAQFNNQETTEDLPVEESSELTESSSYKQGSCDGNCPYKESGSCNGAGSCGGSCGVKTCGCKA